MTIEQAQRVEESAPMRRMLAREDVGGVRR